VHLLEKGAELLPQAEREALAGLACTPVWRHGFIEHVVARLQHLTDVEVLLARHPIVTVNVTSPVDLMVEFGPWGTGWRTSYNGDDDGGRFWSTRAEMVREFAATIRAEFGG
jgi:hypothetical protein